MQSKKANFRLISSLLGPYHIGIIIQTLQATHPITKVSIKMRLFAAILTLFLLPAHFLLAQSEPIMGQDAPEDFEFERPADSEPAFRLLAMDGKTHTLFVRVGSFFAPIEIGTDRYMPDTYAAPRNDNLTFYTRKKDGERVFFTPVLTIPTKGLIDMVVGVFRRDDGTYAGNIVDISIAKMPLSSFSVVNLSPYTMGFGIDKAAVKLKPFESYTREISGAKNGAAVDFKTFDLSGPKPRMTLSTDFSFSGGRRCVVYIFGNPAKEGASSRIVKVERGPR